VNFLEIIR